MVEQARETVDGNAGETYAPLTEAERMEVERLALPRRAAEVRTPEAVLREMLLSAEQKALATSVTELTGESYPSSLRDAEEAASRIRRVLGHFLATGKLDLGGFDYGLCSQEREEYEARMSGAPPPGNRFPGDPTGRGAGR